MGKVSRESTRVSHSESWRPAAALAFGFIQTSPCVIFFCRSYTSLILAENFLFLLQRMHPSLLLLLVWSCYIVICFGKLDLNNFDNPLIKKKKSFLSVVWQTFPGKTRLICLFTTEKTKVIITPMCNLVYPWVFIGVTNRSVGVELFLMNSDNSNAALLPESPPHVGDDHWIFLQLAVSATLQVCLSEGKPH